MAARGTNNSETVSLKGGGEIHEKFSVPETCDRSKSRHAEAKCQEGLDRYDRVGVRHKAEGLRVKRYRVLVSANIYTEVEADNQAEAISKTNGWVEKQYGELTDKATITATEINRG